jgi:ankyrin repeat protein
MKPRRRFLSVVFLVVLGLICLVALASHWAGEQQNRDQDLIMACQIGNVDDVKALLAQGANPNARDMPDHTTSTFGDWFRKLFHPQQDASSTGATALVCAARSRHPFETAKLLIDHGADVKAPSNDEGSVLFWAARDGKAALVQLLLDHGLDPNARESYGWTALRGAILARSPDTVRALLTRGETIQPTDRVEANSEGQPEVLRLLAKRSGAKEDH